MFGAAHKQWEVVILILINTSTSIKFRMVEMDNWLNLNKRPLLGLDPWPFHVRGKPMNCWTTLPPFQNFQKTIEIELGIKLKRRVYHFVI